MHDTTKNIGIGILVTAATGLVVSMLLFLHPSTGDGANRLRVRFSNIDKIGVGTRVTFAGKPVGDVIAIHLVPDAMKRAGNTQDDSIFVYELTLRYDSHVHVFDSDEISVKTSGLMGERTIAITPRRSKKSDPKPLGNDSLTYAASSGSMEEGIANVTRKMEKTMDDVILLLEQNQEDIQKTLKSIESASNELEKILKRTNELDLVGSCKSVLTKAETSIDQVAKNVDTIFTKIANGQGTLGKLICQDDIYMKSMAIFNKADILMNDINQYGPLFHLDKSWQRERRKRTEQLTKLASPIAFQSFLNEEMQKINLSLSRVNMALTKADQNLTDSTNSETKQTFNRSFKELLDDVRELENTLKTLSTENLQEKKMP